MSPELIYLFAGVTALSAVGFVSVAVVWLLKLRQTVSSALTEAAGQQIRMAQRLNESLAEVQKQQENYNRQIHVLAQAGLRLQQELSHVTNRLDNTQSETVRGGQTLH
jgi:predicted  nucleic acid-binding Zn-ribbon protein